MLLVGSTFMFWNAFCTCEYHACSRRWKKALLAEALLASHLHHLSRETVRPSPSLAPKVCLCQLLFCADDIVRHLKPVVRAEPCPVRHA